MEYLRARQTVERLVAAQEAGADHFVTEPLHPVEGTHTWQL